MYSILYFEDHLAFVDLIREILVGFDVVVTPSLKRGRELLATQVFDLLMVDLGLLDSKGVATVDELTPYDIPIMVITASEDMETMQKAVAAGAMDFTCKEDIVEKNLPARIAFLCMRTQKLKQEGKWIRKDPAKSIFAQINIPELYAGLEELRRL